MNTIFIIKKKKITAEANVLLELLSQKAEKIQAAQSASQPVCQDFVHMQVNNHTEACFAETEVFYGKRLAAAYQGLSTKELFGPAYPNERRNRVNRNKLTPAEEELLHQTRVAIRDLQLQ